MGTKAAQTKSSSKTHLINKARQRPSPDAYGLPLKSTDIQYTLLLACLSTMSQNQPTNERPKKFATEPLRQVEEQGVRT
jgi:hypothetical protein